MYPIVYIITIILNFFKGILIKYILTQNQKNEVKEIIKDKQFVDYMIDKKVKKSKKV
mgnify:CR=1 FL=1